jgi:Cu+-exporting ATPase
MIRTAYVHPAKEMYRMATVTDPVCGMTLDSSQAEAQTVYKDKAYYFCSVDCRKTFEANPKEFADKAPVQSPPAGDEPIPL